MFKIACIFDEETGVDATNPLGDLRIANDYSALIVPVTYLDSWLEALVEANGQLTGVGKITVAIPEEPKSLELTTLSDGKLVIGYEGRQVTADSKQSFEIGLRDAVDAFLDRVSALPEAAQNPAVNVLRQFGQAASG